MWYKKNVESWDIANKVEFPDKRVLKDNHEDSIDGWFWSNSEPLEYSDWKESLKPIEGYIPIEPQAIEMARPAEEKPSMFNKAIRFVKKVFTFN